LPMPRSAQNTASARDGDVGPVPQAIQGFTDICRERARLE